MKITRRTRRLTLLMAAVLVLAAVGLAACGGSSDGGTAVPGSSSSAAAIEGFTPQPMDAGTILGAGASFPAPLYMKWGADYANVSDVKLNYQSIGSGGGIAAIEAKTVDFGASDAPLEQAELEANGLVQFPMVVGGVVVVVNLDGVADGQLKLTAGDPRRHLHGQDRRSGTTRPSRPSTPASRCRPPRSTWCTARTARARPGSSRTT